MHEDSCGRKGIGETPQCVARGGSPASRGKRVYFRSGELRRSFISNTKIKKQQNLRNEPKYNTIKI
ncbi:hypothetical protein [Virgibacillus sp. DJP39]|uniref:hypothetical protein n=1 Tax=Virgibacillus sp. DJP39 TaxID=3409790 RepID=UPI003BB5F6DB